MELLQDEKSAAQTWFVKEQTGNAISV